MPAEIFARTVNGVIVQYPVTIDDINARNTPTDIYLPCLFSDQLDPLVPGIGQKIAEAPQIIGGAVYVIRTIVLKTIEELFLELRDLTGVPEGPIPNTSVSLELFGIFENAAKIKVQATLDAFANTRDYDNLTNLCSYDNSLHPAFQTEAARGIVLRDQTWATLHVYLGELMAGTKPIPLSWTDVEPNLPALTWEP